MKRKNTYKTVDIQKLELTRVLALIAGAVTVAIDVAKEAIVFGLADSAGKTHALVRFSHPRQTPLFLAMVERIRELGHTAVAALEPSGAYSQPFVHQLRARGLEVFRVDPKACHDVASVLDGVSSQHDAKSCTLIAYLHAQGLSKPWRARTAAQRAARALGKEHAMWSKTELKLYGELEAMTAACWPELNALMEHRSQWYLHLLAAYPGPAATAAAPPEEVRALLRKVSSGLLAPGRVEEVLRSAHASMGEPLEESEQAFLQELVREMLRLRAASAAVEKRMRAFIASDAEGSISRVAGVVGPALATTMFAELGNPASYTSAAALEKACGLNLREKSSGQHQGRLRITKRGPARVRHLLYMAALRWLLEHPEAKAWYERRSAYAAGLKKKAVVAVMRKIVRALFHVARGSVFDVRKLFDTRVLTEAPGAAGAEQAGGRRASPSTASASRSRTPEGMTSSAV